MAVGLSPNWVPCQQLLLHTGHRDLGVRSTRKQWEKEGAALNWQIFVGAPLSSAQILQCNLTAALHKCSSESEEDGTMHQSPGAFIPPGPLSSVWGAALLIRQH